MIEELLKNPAFAELYKNAPTYNVDGKHTFMGSSIPPVLPPISNPVINNLPNITPPIPNNNGNSKTNNRVVLVIVLSLVGGFVIVKGIQWWDDYQNKKNSKV
jgi:hypothetical protein